MMTLLQLLADELESVRKASTSDTQVRWMRDSTCVVHCQLNSENRVGLSLVKDREGDEILNERSKLVSNTVHR